MTSKISWYNDFCFLNVMTKLQADILKTYDKYHKWDKLVLIKL